MTNAVLVLNEMPTKCRKCPCRYIDQHGDAICKAKRRFIDTGDGSKHNWCPLKGLPEKKQERDASEYEFGILGKGFEQGWNVCINEITGKTEGKND